MEENIPTSPSPIQDSNPITTSSSSPNGTTATPPKKQRMYPELIIPNNTHPNKLYAFPVVGLVIKFIILIPVLIVSLFVGLIYGVLSIVTPFVILFTGKYWNTAYTFTLGYFTYTAKIQLFLAGITDKYPGFTLEPNGIFEIRLPKPESPSRLMAFPGGGYVGRFLILIPYAFYQTVLQYGMYVAIIASWFGVWIKGNYPESLYEFIKDELRVSLAYDTYMTYLSDTYPSFKISMNHKKIKIILLILGIVFTLVYSAYEINNALYTAQHPYSRTAPASNNSGSIN